MQTEEFVQFLLDNHVPVFTLNDAVKVLHKKRDYTKLFLHRCIKRGILGSAERGVYYLSQRSNEYEIASNIIKPSYVSMVSALYYYGLTTQVPRVVYVVSTNRHRPLRNVQGFDIIFKKINKAMLFGYRKTGAGNIFMADPEKAIIDIFYFHDINDLADDVMEKPSRIDMGKLALYAKASGKRYVVADTAAFLEEHGYPSHARRLLGKKPMK